MEQQTPEGDVRSFILRFYDGVDRPMGTFRLPLTIAAGCFKRLIQDADLHGLKEPWYRVRLLDRDESAEMEGPPDDPLEPGAAADGPSLRPAARHTHFRVDVMDFESPLTQGVFSVAEVFGAAAGALARRLAVDDPAKDSGAFTYDLLGSEAAVHPDEDALPARPLPDIPGVFQIPAQPSGDAIDFEAIPDPVLPVRDPADLGKPMTCGRGADPETPVFLRRAVFHSLNSGMAFSADAESGGFLMGDPFRLPGSPEDPADPGFRWGVDVTHVAPAEATLASRVYLLLTGETWSRVVRLRDRELPGKEIVGWFHTHLFSATDDFGLSHLDIDLHARHLTRPWQVALLINLGPGGDRELRCFQWSPDRELVECRYEVIP